jgi:hypothetical protein
MAERKVIPSKQLLYASTIQTLEDISKTEACQNKYVHCAFPFDDFTTCRQPLEDNLKKLGVLGLMWHGIIRVDFQKDLTSV